MEPFSAKPGQQIILDSQDEVSSIDSIIHLGSNSDYPIIAWTDKSLKTLKLNILGQKDVTTVHVPKHDEPSLQRISIHASVGVKTPGHFLVGYHAKDAHWAKVYHINKVKNSIEKSYDIRKLDGPGAFAVSEVAGDVYFVRHSETEMFLLSSESHDILEQWPIKLSINSLPASRSSMKEATVEVAPKGSSKFAVRSMLRWESGDVVLIRNGEHDWTRSESLAGISAATWADLPQTLNLAKTLESEIYANFISAYIHRVVRHIKDLEHFSGWLQSIPQRTLRSFGLSSGPVSDQLLTDSFGFRKLVIVATQKGRVAALDAGSYGQVLWNIQAVQLEEDEIWNVKQILIRGDLAWIITDDVSKSIFVTLSGEIKTDWPLDETPQGSRLLPLTMSSKSVMASISRDGVPSFKTRKESDAAVTLVTQRQDGSLAGWTSSGDQAVKTWEFVPLKGYKIAAISTRPDHDPVASIGKALGDRNVLYKFLSPNLLLVTSLNNEESKASISLLDTINGQILHNAEHNDIDVSGGVTATLAENWFAYILQSDPTLASTEAVGRSKGSQLTIVELYESFIPNDRGPLGTASNVSSLHSASYSPHVESATYILSNTLQNLTTTTTKQGITPRSILAYVPSLAALVAVPIAVLSPRRPVGREPTMAEKEEGLFKYMAVIDINPTWILSHKRELLGIRGIISTPSDMESTSLVFSYGDLDVFGTRVAPIGTFDMLGKGFNKVQLILTVVALAIGTGILAPMVSNFSHARKDEKLRLDTGQEEADRRSMACVDLAGYDLCYCTQERHFFAAKSNIFNRVLVPRHLEVNHLSKSAPL